MIRHKPRAVFSAFSLCVLSLPFLHFLRQWIKAVTSQTLIEQYVVFRMQIQTFKNYAIIAMLFGHTIPALDREQAHLHKFI